MWLGLSYKVGKLLMSHPDVDQIQGTAANLLLHNLGRNISGQQARPLYFH